MKKKINKLKSAHNMKSNEYEVEIVNLMNALMKNKDERRNAMVRHNSELVKQLTKVKKELEQIEEENFDNERVKER